jgi:cytochrome c
MKTLDIIRICLVLIFVINISCSSPKSDKQNTIETVQTDSPKRELIAEARIPATELSAPVASDNVARGEKLFKEKNCVVCHQLNAKLIGPSLKDVAKAYAGKKDKLNSFLKGDAKSIIDPAQHAIMEPQIAITKAMSEADRLAIVEYLLSISH